jgi:hypothetical protein
MLSKYYYYSKNKTIERVHDSEALKLRHYLSDLGYSEVETEIAQFSSTLGVFYSLKLDGKEYIAKTHLPGDVYYDNLIKEYEIFHLLYADIMKITLIELECEKNAYIIMDVLSPIDRKISMEIARSLLEEINQKISEDKIHSVRYDLGEILSQTLLCTEKMAQKMILSKEIAEKSKEYLHILQKLLLEPRILCHGDLSNKNIMMCQGEYVFIDWEDALWGVQDYDYCYWLTFLDQRKYYGQEPLRGNHHNVEESKALMLMIVLMKCWISVCNGQVGINKITFDERINEILLIK